MSRVMYPTLTWVYCISSNWDMVYYVSSVLSPQQLNVSLVTLITDLFTLLTKVGAPLSTLSSPHLFGSVTTQVHR